MEQGTSARSAWHPKVRSASHIIAAAALMLAVFEPAQAEISQVPLYLGGGNVPGNLVLVPSVEWPTINSVANLGDYSENSEYIGYFNPNKCYAYNYDANESQRHFYPVSDAANHRCSGQWSGNFLNWAATQTIDPFRKVLTGGYRVKDTPTETWLEKARHDGQGNVYPNRRIPASGNNSSLVSGATPFSSNSLYVRIDGLGNEMRFRRDNSDVDSNVQDYDPSQTLGNRGYDVTIRVKVCDPNHLEANCRKYSDGWKPEGLIQQYADELRVSVFGYLNDHDMLRDGGVLRARQKFVGPTMLVAGEAGRFPNPQREWDPETGVQLRNPDSADASATSSLFGIDIDDSGVINYLNKFGQMTSKDHKNYDPVSEMYYAALRYLKDQGPVAAYASMSGSASAKYEYADGFPVITNWDDPVEYACQKNVLLGIGDIYTHRDKNLPGSSYSADEPSKPGEVSNDNTVDVVQWTNRVGTLEGISGSLGNTNDWTGRYNSAYVAGLAYYANTTDLRDDIPGTQTASTHWVDVLEEQSLETPNRNQYFLATKYGGFNVPKDVEFDPATFTGSLPLEWWHTNGEILTSFGSRAQPAGVQFHRPDNYYLAGGAQEMVESLTKAFARISAELRSSASSVAANSTRVDTDTAVFQASFDSRRWSGGLQAFSIDEDGTIEAPAKWSAAEALDALTEGQVSSRKIFTVVPPAEVPSGPSITTTGVNFEWASLSSSQQDALRMQRDGTQVSVTVAQDRLAYLRGSRLQEPPGGLFRQRDSRLGDIVNSDPQFVHKQDFGYTLLAQSGAFNATVASAYRTFRESVTYQNRAPMVIVGANDGMLHGFHAGLDSNGGKELFAFVPNGVFEHLYELTLPDYVHRYYVDGTPRVADAWLGGTKGWRTIVVGTTAAGGRSVFALDITNPTTMTAANVLWEFQHSDLGYTMGQPSVAPLPNGEFGVIVTSGYTGNPGGKIWVLDPADGSIVHTFDVPNSGNLGAPLVVDLNGDRVADRIYVGDTEGQLWRFDLTGSSPSGWGPPPGLKSGGNPLPLFVAVDGAGNPQPITASLTSAFNERGQHMVFFGTGIFYQLDDNVVPPSPPVNSFYGIIDRGVQITDRTNLLEQEILAEQSVNGQRVRGVTANTMDFDDDGWYLDLMWKGKYSGPGAKGERVVSRALVRGDRVIFTTLIPNPDPCSAGGDSWLMELHSFSGGRLAYTVFDIDLDGDYDMQDTIQVVLPDGGGTIEIPVSGLDPDIGIIDTPAVLVGAEDENKVVSGSTGELMRIKERGSISIGRQSWRQLR